MHAALEWINNVESRKEKKNNDVVIKITSASPFPLFRLLFFYPYLLDMNMVNDEIVFVWCPQIKSP